MTPELTFDDGLVERLHRDAAGGLRVATAAGVLHGLEVEHRGHRAAADRLFAELEGRTNDRTAARLHVLAEHHRTLENEYKTLIGLYRRPLAGTQQKGAS